MAENNDYKVTKFYIKDIDFTVLILVVPEIELEDKLAYLAREKGLVSKNFYDDFIIATCVANINQLLNNLNNQNADLADIVKIREIVVGEIIKNNPKLDPETIYINSNHVLKLDSKKLDKTSLVKLVDNKNWNLSYYDEDSEEFNLDDLESVFPELVNDLINEGKEQKNNKNTAEDEAKNIESGKVKKWWKRIGQYINIKKYNDADLEKLLKNKFFHNRTSFSTYVVSTCVEDFEELFSLLDNMGIPSRVAPPLLIHEIYELCREVNPKLIYENVQKSNDDDTVDSGGNKKSKATGALSKLNNKKKPKKSFKDVPKQDLLKLGDNMKVFLIGQDKAVDVIAEAIQRASVGLKDPDRPIGSFLFAGRTGIGKSLTTKVLADELIKDRDNLVTVDCSEYSADHEYAKLIGSPAGYVGHEAGGFLTNHMQKNPFSVVVFDEVEKASRKVHELLLQVLEEGRLTDGKGKTVSFKDAVIIMTSNVGVDEIDAIKKTIGFGSVATITEKKKDKALDDALKKKFKPEFLNRIDAIVHFNTLSDSDYMRIIDIELYKLNDNLRTNDTEYKNLELNFDKKVKKIVFNNGIDPEFGARPLKRCIEKMISTPLAQKLLAEEIDPNSIVNVTVAKNKIIFAFDKKEENPPFYLEKTTATEGEQEVVVEDDSCDGCDDCNCDK